MAKGNNEIIQESKLKRGGAIAPVLIMIGVAAALTSCGPKPHTVGSVNTEFKLIGPDHKIVIESYDDPKVDGVTVFISKSRKGGIKGPPRAGGGYVRRLRRRAADRTDQGEAGL